MRTLNQNTAQRIGWTVVVKYSKRINQTTLLLEQIMSLEKSKYTEHTILPGIKLSGLDMVVSLPCRRNLIYSLDKIRSRDQMKTREVKGVN